MIISVREALSGLSDKQFAHVAHMWGMDGEAHADVHDFQARLQQRMQDPIAARFVWEYLAPDERKVLYRVLAPDVRYNGLEYSVLETKLQLSADSLAAAVEKLTYSLLLWQAPLKTGNASTGKKSIPVTRLYTFNESYTKLYATGGEVLGPADGRIGPLGKLLLTLDYSKLYNIGMNYSLKLGNYRSATDLALLIATKLLELGNLLDHLPKLAPQARNIFTWLCERGGQATMQEVRTYTRTDDTTLWQILEALENHALAFDTFKKQERVLVIPQDIYLNWQMGTSTSKELQLNELATPPTTIHTSETVMLYDMATLLGTIYQQNIEPTQAGRVPKRLATKIRPQLRGQARMDYQGEDDYLEMLLYAALQLHLVQRSRPPLPEIKPCYEPGRQLESWSRRDSIEQTQYLLHQWITGFQWRDTLGQNFDSLGSYGWNPCPGREALLSYLSRCAPGHWYSIDSLLEIIWQENAFALHMQYPYNLATQLKKRKTLEQYNTWKRCDGEIYIGMLTSSLYEMGIIETGYSTPDALNAKKPINPSAFRLTELGAASITSRGKAQPKTESSSQQRTLIVQPSFELLLMQPDFSTLYSLLPFAQVNQVGVVSRLTLTRASILRGQESGKHIEWMIQTLEQHSQKALPQNVVYTLNDWARSYKEANVSQAILLEVSSEEAANQLTASTKLQMLGIQKLAPCMLIIKSDVNLQELKRILDKEGIVSHMSRNMSPQSTQSPQGPYGPRTNRSNFRYGRP